MAPWQVILWQIRFDFKGPALLIYNNEKFSKSDWERCFFRKESNTHSFTKKVGNSSKKLDPDSIGLDFFGEHS